MVILRKFSFSALVVFVFATLMFLFQASVYASSLDDVPAYEEYNRPVAVPDRIETFCATMVLDMVQFDGRSRARGSVVEIDGIFIYMDEIMIQRFTDASLRGETVTFYQWNLSFYADTADAYAAYDGDDSEAVSPGHTWTAAYDGDDSEAVSPGHTWTAIYDGDDSEAVSPRHTWTRGNLTITGGRFLNGVSFNIWNHTIAPTQTRGTATLFNAQSQRLDTDTTNRLISQGQMQNLHLFSPTGFWSRATLDLTINSTRHPIIEMR